MYAVLKLLLVPLLSPVVTSALGALVALLCHKLGRVRMAKRIGLFAITWLLIWSQPYMSKLLLHPLEHSASPASADAPFDVIWVLACYYNTRGNITPTSRWSDCSLQRNVEALRLYHKTGKPIVVSGGNFLKDPTVNYSEQAKKFFLELGVASEHLITLPTGTTTQQELAAARSLLSGKRVAVVSSATHTQRLTRQLKPIAQEMLFFPVDYHSDGDLVPHLALPSIYALEGTRIAFYEYLALTKTLLFN